MGVGVGGVGVHTIQKRDNVILVFFIHTRIYVYMN